MQDASSSSERNGMSHLQHVSSPTPRGHAPTLASVVLLVLLFPPAPAVALMPLVPRDSCGSSSRRASQGRLPAD